MNVQDINQQRFRTFLESHQSNLTYLYHTILPSYLRERISLDAWINFAYKNSLTADQ